MNQASSIKGAYTLVQRNAKSLKLSAAGYYRVEWDGYDELRMHDLVWVDSTMYGLCSSVSKGLFDTMYVWSV